MKLVELTEYLVKNLVKEPDLVSVKEFDEDEADTITIQVLVGKGDMGRVVGHRGNIANAVRTIVQAASYVDQNKRVIINIDEF
jgi:predicted RNA-binding protein YlqC (UPF0109 family)